MKKRSPDRPTAEFAHQQTSNAMIVPSWSSPVLGTTSTRRLQRARSATLNRPGFSGGWIYLSPATATGAF
jgi:hypothetical protein